MEILNLGCGTKLIEDAVNVDILDLPGVMVYDLNVLPWPWSDREFGKVVARDILEHLRLDLVEVMDEIWRVTSSGGILLVKVPYWRSENAHDGLCRWAYNKRSFDIFDPTTRLGKLRSYYTPRKWKVLSVKLGTSRLVIYAKLRRWSLGDSWGLFTGYEQ